MIGLFLLLFIFITFTTILYQVYTLTHSITNVFIIFVVVGMIFIYFQPDIGEFEQKLEDIFEIYNEEIIDEQTDEQTVETSEPEEIVFDFNIFYILLLPFFLVFLFIVIVVTIYKSQRRYSRSRAVKIYNRNYSTLKKEALIRRAKIKGKRRKQIIKTPPDEIGDYNLVKSINDLELESIKKQYQQIGHWIHIYDFHNSKFLYISKWTKPEKGVYGKPKWVKSA